MTDDALRNWMRSDLRQRLSAAGISSAVCERAFNTVTLLPDVLDRQAHQPEFNRTIAEYLAIAASEDRIRSGRQAQRRHRQLINQIEALSGVGGHVITAIWGLETNYGTKRGDYPVLSALATLAYAGTRRDFFEEEFVNALMLVDQGHIAPEDMLGSWAGAMGHGQFMPSSVLRSAVDFDGDGRCNIWGDDPSDALASIANYLKSAGWKPAQPWGIEVTLPEGFDVSQCGLATVLPTKDWQAMGVRQAIEADLADYGPASVLLPAGITGIAFMVYRNFHVLLRYNRAVSYAIGVGHLSDRIDGEADFEGAWPEGQSALSRAKLRAIQTALNERGYDTGGIDGIAGRATESAVRKFQLSAGLVPDAFIGPEVISALGLSD